MDSEEEPGGLAIGELFLEKFRVERVLGAGGCGTVYAARHVELGELMAIKLVTPDRGDAIAIERFLREARVAARIRSPYVARVHDVALLADGSAYMVLEYLEGSDLRAMVRDGGPIDVATAADFGIQTCHALAHAHARGIVHRDVKPANLFCVMDDDGSRIVKLLDFGVARTAVPARDAELTTSFEIVGSPRYMAPEQLANSHNVDPRADVWGLGVTLFELIAGRPPFSGVGLGVLFASIQSEDPPPLVALRPDVPPELAAVVARCLEKDRGRRFQNVGLLASALAPFASPASRALVDRIGAVLGVVGSENETARTPSAIVAAPRRLALPRRGVLLVVTAAPVIPIASVLFALALRTRTQDGAMSPDPLASGRALEVYAATATVTPSASVVVSVADAASSAAPRSRVAKPRRRIPPERIELPFDRK